MNTEIQTVKKSETATTLIVLPGTRKGEEPSYGLAKRTPGGEIRAVRTRVRLDKALGHVYDLGQYGGGLNISAVGYDRINQALGVSRFMPATLLGSDGEVHANPWELRDKQGNITRVTVKVAGFARNAVGNWALISSTLLYDLAPMLAQDALKKWRPKVKGAKFDAPRVPQSWGKMYEARKVPKLDGEHGATFHNIPIPGGTVLVVDLKEGAVLDLIDGHVHRVRFCVRNAETIAWRRVMKVFVGQAKMDPNDPCVAVTAWPQPDRDNVHDIQDLVEQADQGYATVDGEPIDVSGTTATVDDPEDSANELHGEAAEDGAEPTTQPDAKTAADLALHRAQIKAYANQLPGNVVDKLLGDVGLAGLAEADVTGEVDLLIAARAVLAAAIENRKRAATTAAKP